MARLSPSTNSLLRKLTRHALASVLRSLGVSNKVSNLIVNALI